MYEAGQHEACPPDPPGQGVHARRDRGLSREVGDPRGLSDTLVAGDKEQSPGVLRNIHSVFAPEFGEKWLEKELGR